jgi:ubiquinone/menaquinone biosynthesis C-methylase UbiE
MTVPRSSQSFDAGAAGYEATIARTLLPVARRVVDRAALRPNERVLDVGTGTGNAAAAAVGEGRTVVGVDGAPGMLEIARARVPAATFEVMDFTALGFEDASFDVLVSSHALHFATDREAALSEWLRVTRPGGRLSLSGPGPLEVTPSAVYAEIYAGVGIDTRGRYLGPDELRAIAESAGWTGVKTEADPSLVIRLETEELFRTWRRIGSRAEATRDWSEEQHEQLTLAMLAATPRDQTGAFLIPFGSVYLSARRPLA